MSRSVSFAMQCPECDADVDDIEVSVHVGHRTEHFWGAPVRVDESECEVETIPKCPDCKRQTIDEGHAIDYYWDRVYS